MEIIYLLVPLSLVLSSLGLVAFLWALRTGQFKDVETPQIRILFDDEEDKREE